MATAVDNVDVLYLENGNVDTQVLKNKSATMFLFLVVLYGGVKLFTFWCEEGLNYLSLLSGRVKLFKISLWKG